MASQVPTRNADWVQCVEFPGLVVCLVAQGAEVGVDLESYERAGEIAELSERVFSPLELAQLEELHGSEKTNRALCLWTLKEAYLKAQGMDYRCR